MATKVLSKEEFMAMVINDKYKKKFAEKEKSRQADCYIVGRLSSDRDRRLKKRGF